MSPEGQELSPIRSDAVNSHTACHAVSQFRSNGTVLVNVCVDFFMFLVLFKNLVKFARRT